MTDTPTNDEPTGQEAAEDLTSPAPHQPSMLRNLVHLMSAQMVTWVLAAAVTVVLPRYLGPEDIGRLRLPWAIWAIAQLFVMLGTSTYLTLEMARNRTRGMQLVGPIIVLRFVAFLVASGVLAIITLIIGSDGQDALIMLLIGVTVLLTSLGDVFAAALTGLEQMSYPAMAGIVSKSLYTLAVIGVLIAGGDVVTVVAVGLVGSGSSFLILGWSFNRVGRVALRSPFKPMRHIVAGSMIFFISGAVLTVYQQIDTIVISTLVDKTALGWYTTADTLFSTLLFVPTVLLATIFPRFGRLHVEDPAGLVELLHKAFSSLVVLAVPIGLGTIVTANTASVLLYGNKFRETGPVLAVYGVVLILVYGTVLFGGLANAIGRQRFWNTLLVISILASIPLDIVLVPWTDRRYDNGAIGGALAYVVTESFMLIVGLWKIAPSLLERSALARTLKILAAGAAMFACTWPLRDRFILIPIGVGIAVYAPLIVLLGALTADQRSIAWRVLARFGLGPWKQTAQDADSARDATLEPPEEGGTNG